MVFIQITNDKSQYMKGLTNDIFPIEKKVIKENEFMSILETVTSISFVPSYLNARMELDSNVTYIQIHLPYLITKMDLENAFKGEISDTTLIRKVLESNSSLLNVIGNENAYRYVQPPLARLLGQQAFDYMDICLKDETLRKLVFDTSYVARTNIAMSNNSFQ